MPSLTKEQLQFMRDELGRLQSVEDSILTAREAHVRNIFFGWSITFSIIGVLIKAYENDNFLLTLGLALSFGLGFLMSSFLFLRLLNNIASLSISHAQKFMARKFFDVHDIIPLGFSFPDINVIPSRGETVVEHCNAFTPRTNLFAIIYVLGTGVLFLFPAVISAYLTIIFFLRYRIVNVYLALSPAIVMAIIVTITYYYLFYHHYKKTRKLSEMNLEVMLGKYKYDSVYCKPDTNKETDEF